MGCKWKSPPRNNFQQDIPLGCPRKLGSMVSNLLINGIYWVITHLLTSDPNFQRVVQAVCLPHSKLLQKTTLVTLKQSNMSTEKGPVQNPSLPNASWVVNNHGDRFRPPRIGLWDPFHSWPFYIFLWLINGVDHGLILTILTKFMTGQPTPPNVPRTPAQK